MSGFETIWPTGDRQPTPEDLFRIYESGYPGCLSDPAEKERLLEDGVVSTFSDACDHLRGYSESVDAAYLFRALVELERRAGLELLYETEPQPYGNCVARGSQHARATTNAVEILLKGEPEIYERPAWESTYRARGHRGHGMDPALAARCDVDLGFLWRRQYPFADLRTQNPNWGVRLGHPNEVLKTMSAHKVGRWIAPETEREALDLLASGYACHSGQNVGFSSRPSVDGTHPKRGEWNHDLATVGYDFSRRFWNRDVVFVANSWGAWNEQWTRWPKELGDPIAGFIVVRREVWAEYFVGSGSIYFYCDVEGIPAKRLENWGAEEYL